MKVTEQIIERIIALGPTDKARAKTLGVSMRTITDYKTGKIPRIVISLIEQGIIAIPTDTTNQTSQEAERTA